MAAESSKKAGGARSILGIGLIGLGALLITLALAIAFFVVPAQKKTPLDTLSLTVTDVYPGNLLVGSAFAAGEPLEENQERPECSPGDDEGAPDEEAGPEDEAAPAEEGAPEDEAAPGEEGSVPMSCFMLAGTPLYSQRNVTTVEPSDSDVVTMEVAQSVIRDDVDSEDGADALVSATIDRLTTDRLSAEPVDEPTSTVQLVSTGDPENDPTPTGFTRQGLQYKFPFDTAQEDYDYFDAATFTTNPISFVEESEVNGIDVYVFEQELGPINMFESIRDHFAETEDGYSEAAESVLASYRMEGRTAADWGLDGEADREVTMDRYYTNTRTVWVNPDTGQIVNGSEVQFQFFAEGQEEAEAFFSDAEAVAQEKNEPTRTAVSFVAAWDEETKARTSEMAQESLDRLNNFGTTVPLVLGVLGVLALIGGGLAGLRGGKKRS